MNKDKKILAALLRKDFSSFIHKVFNTINPGTLYRSNWHIDLIADYLENVRLGGIKRLIINMPPRALKSVCVSVAWPSWLLGQNAAYRILAASYSSTLSTKHSLDSRLVVSSEWYRNLFPKTILSKKHNQKTKFLTTQNGFRFATSVGGSVTGEGGDFLIIDDPHNPSQINSKKLRHKAIDWFEQTFVSRLNDQSKGAIILVMQRLHHQDLSAHLLNLGGWELLKIPAIAKEKITYLISAKKYIYPKENILNKSRDSLEYLGNIEKEIGTKNYLAQYLQEPAEDNSSLLQEQDIHFYQSLPKQFEHYILSWDTAIKTNDSSDYSVGTCWGLFASQYYLVSMIRKKLNYPCLKNEIIKQINRFNPKYILIEDKASGQSLIQDLGIAGYLNIKAIKPKLDKITRFASVVTLFQAGKILLPRNSAFNHELISELTKFPNTKHDDIVDSVGQFLLYTKGLGKMNRTRIRVF
ncbi:MAG: phage terminase large subunit [Rickettsiales bacterium]|nr:phage terminase large subunit [Rickettsiales bacterium]MCA0254705.1 phage terminase large subunit [Pseudomonadota bacterium]